MSELLILFDQDFYKHHDGVAMVSVFFLCYHERIWLQNCPSEFKPVIYRRYVDDILLIFCSKHHTEKLQNHLNRQHENIRLTSETQNENSISFLVIKVSGDNNKFTTSVYCKPKLAEFLPVLVASSRTCCLPYYYTEH